MKSNGDFKFKLRSREKAIDQLIRHLNILSGSAGNDYRDRETIEPICLIPENEENNSND